MGTRTSVAWLIALVLGVGSPGCASRQETQWAPPPATEASAGEDEIQSVAPPASASSQPGERAVATSDEERAEMAKEAASPAAREACPMFVEEAQVQVEPTAEGVALVFTAAPEAVRDLRDRIEALAARYNRYTSRITAPPGAETGMGAYGAGGIEGSDTTLMIPARAAAEPLTDGSRLVLVPLAPADAAALRRRIRQEAVALDAGTCSEEFLMLETREGGGRAE